MAHGVGERRRGRGEQKGTCRGGWQREPGLRRGGSRTAGVGGMQEREVEEA